MAARTADVAVTLGGQQADLGALVLQRATAASLRDQEAVLAPDLLQRMADAFHARHEELYTCSPTPSGSCMARRWRPTRCCMVARSSPSASASRSRPSI